VSSLGAAGVRRISTVHTGHIARDLAAWDAAAWDTTNTSSP